MWVFVRNRGNPRYGYYRKTIDEVEGLWRVQTRETEGHFDPSEYLSVWLPTRAHGWLRADLEPNVELTYQVIVGHEDWIRRYARMEFDGEVRLPPIPHRCATKLRREWRRRATLKFVQRVLWEGTEFDDLVRAKICGFLSCARTGYF